MDGIPLTDEQQNLRAQLEQLHRRAGRWALVCCSWKTDEAEEVLHMAYERILSGRARFQGESSFSTWALGVVRMCARERRRSFLRLVGLSGEIDDGFWPSPSDNYQQAKDAERLRNAMLKLSAKQREIVGLVFYADLSVEEAARVMGLSLGSARTHYARAKQRLAKLLAQQEIGT